MHAVFIQTNNKQLLGANLAKFAIAKHLADPSSTTISMMNVDGHPAFSSFAGKSYMRGGARVVYDPSDLQSFTLSRFMPPELRSYRGRALVIDPDIFALTDITALLESDMNGSAVLACKKKGAWDTSVMLMDCARLKHWNIAAMLRDLADGTSDYTDIISLSGERSAGELSRDWNDLDHLGPDTKMLHTTNRLTQPWKTGLPIDFNRKDPGKLLGIVPRRWIGRLIGSWPSQYQPHPDKTIDRFFFKLLNDALADGAVTKEQVRSEIDAGHVRQDALALAARS